MKKLLVGLCAMFTISVCATTINLDWRVDNNTYAQTTCELGADLIIPSTTPTKRGYHFIGWKPNDFTQLDYIESTGVEYLNIGNPFTTANNRIEAGVTPLGASASQYLFGSMNHSPYVGFFLSTSGFLSVVNNNNLQATQTNIQWVLGTSYDVVIQNNAQDSYADINGSRTSLVYRGVPTADMILFGLIYNSAFGGERVKISYFKAYDNKVLVRNLIPARRNIDNVLGMYDTVSGTFFTNASTGEFIAGPESANQTLE